LPNRRRPCTLSTEMATNVTNHIEATPGVCGGKPRIAGRRIRVQDIAVWHELLGMTPDEIVTEYPDLTLADVHAALSYYFDNLDDIQQDIRQSEQLVEAIRAMTPSKLPDGAGPGDATSVSSR